MAWFTAFLVCIFLPSEFDFIGHSLRVCSKSDSFGASLIEFWLWDTLPICIVFLAGLTIYIPVLSIACSAFGGIILALDVYAFFNSFGVFFAITMTFIRLCAVWLFLWYLSYISTACIRLYTSPAPISKGLDYVFVGKYIVWFAVFAISTLLLDCAQCIMYRI